VCVWRVMWLVCAQLVCGVCSALVRKVHEPCGGVGSRGAAAPLTSWLAGLLCAGREDLQVGQSHSPSQFGACAVHHEAQCGTVLCGGGQCCTARRCAVLCCTVLCCAVLCYAVLCCAVRCNRAVQLCCAVLCCAVLCCAVLCCAVPLYCAVLCCFKTEIAGAQR
jgi:hypothetical protein